MHAIGGCGLAALAVAMTLLAAAWIAIVGRLAAPAPAWDLVPSALYGWIAAALGVILLKLGLVAELLVQRQATSSPSGRVREIRLPSNRAAQHETP